MKRPFVVAGAVPDHDHSAAQPAEQILKEVDDPRGVDVGPRVGFEIEAKPTAPRGDAERRDRRDFVALPPESGQNGRPTLRRPGAADQRIEEKPALVDQDEVCPLVPRFF